MPLKEVCQKVPQVANVVKEVPGGDLPSKAFPEVRTEKKQGNADTVADSVLKLLEKKGLLHADTGSKRSTEYGEAISSSWANQLLCKDSSIIVEHPNVLHLKKGQYPTGGMAFVGEFPGFGSEEYKQALLFATAFLHGIGVRISSLAELKRLNAADNLTAVDTTDSLSAEEKKAAKDLSSYVEGVDGYFSPVNMPVLKGGILHYYKWGPSKTGKVPGIYDPEKKTGFFRRRMERISVSEALNKLKNEKPIVIIKKDGTELIS